MELAWLEDFLALAEQGSFVRAAEARYITQPAFSRRIRALEQWMGVELFVRTPQGATLTEAGQHILSNVQDSTRRLYRIRSEAQEMAGKAAKTLHFAATHSLSFTFFPRWIRIAERGTPLEAVTLLSDNMASCEQMLLQGQAQFLLCYRHPEVPLQLESVQFESKKIGEDVLIPLSGSSADFSHQSQALPYLAYTQGSGLGRIVAHQLQGKQELLHLKPSFSSHLAAVLMSMALENKGIAWLPKTLTEQEVVDGRLSQYFEPSWDIPVDVHLIRLSTPLSAFAEQFWAQLQRD